MSAPIHIQLQVTPDAWVGIGSDDIKVSIGTEAGTLRPYELLLMSLGGCLHSTFQDIAGKMRVSWNSIVFDIQGEKRQTPPTTLKHCRITAAVSGADQKQKLEKAFETAARYCSVYQTLSKVAEMEWHLEFTD